MAVLEATTRARGATKRNVRSRRENLAAYAFLSPWLIGMLLFLIGPILASIVLSFTDWNLLYEPSWVGTANYQEMFSGDDRFFWIAVGVTLRYAIVAVPLYLVAGLGLALLLNLRLRGMYVFRTILFLPSVLSGVAVAILFATLFNPDAGAINDLLRAIGIQDPPRWLSSPTWALPAVIIIGLWGVGGGSIIFLAGLQNISPSLYDAAAIDGAGAWGRFRHITLPMLSPTLLFVLLTSLIGAFQFFDIAYVLGSGGVGGTGSGMGGSLRFYLLHLWLSGFQDGRFGYASALAWLLVVAAGVVILLVFKTASRRVFYEEDPEARA
jgi:multiple sugar transport system permease protein